jgi:peptidyl-prolyl cis-trans isomerase D
MVFNDFVFNSSIGSIGLVETPGFHIIKTDKQDGIRLATVA